MHVLVELFDLSRLENVAAAMIYKPQKVIFIGFAEMMTEKRRRDILRFFRIKKISAEAEFKTVGRYDFRSVIQCLEEIADENDDVGFCDGAFGLSRHFFDDAFALDGFKAPRVDDDVRTRPHPALTVLSVARQPREIRHDGVPAAGKAVKEGGLPHIGASDQSHNWQHRYSVYVVLLKSPTIIPGAPPSRYALRPSE